MADPWEHEYEGCLVWLHFFFLSLSACWQPQVSFLLCGEYHDVLADHKSITVE